jgi:hypothetical protein
MLEILKTQEPPPDTTIQDTVVTDTTVQADTVQTDTTAQDTTLSIGMMPGVRATAPKEPKLYFDAKEQSLYIRFNRDGKERRYRVTGKRQ